MNLDVDLQNQISQKSLLHDKMRFLLVIPAAGFGLTAYRSSGSTTALTPERFAQSTPVFLQWCCAPNTDTAYTLHPLVPLPSAGIQG